MPTALTPEQQQTVHTTAQRHPVEGHAMSHHCHATGCTANVPPEMFACRRHWFALPKRLRDRIWATYRPGQCEDWQISHEYAEAAREAVRYLAEKDGVEPDVSVYDCLDPARFDEDTP